MEATVESLAPRLLSYCLGRLGDASLAEEVSHEALAALVQRWRRHGAPDSPAAFVFAIARRRAGALSRRYRRAAPLQESALGPEGHRAPDELYTPRERLARVRAALSTLPATEREALLLVAVGELSTTEAARTQRVTRSAVKMRVHRARRKLRTLLWKRAAIGHICRTRVACRGRDGEESAVAWSRTELRNPRS